MSGGSLWVKGSTQHRLDKFCKKTGSLKGDDYYKVSDYDKAINNLLDRQNIPPEEDK